MEPLNILGCLEGGNVLYRMTGSQGIDYDLKFLVTDFHGRSWRASFSLRDVLDSLDAYEPEEEELLQWISNCLDRPGQPPKLLKAPGGRIQAVQAFHSIQPVSQHDKPIMIRLLFPPTDALEEVSGKHAQVDSQALAKALFDAYCKERRAAAGALRERDQLQEQVTDLEASCTKLQDRLRELKPGAFLSSSGSFKRQRDGGSLGTLPTGTQGPESPRAAGHQSNASPRAAPSHAHENNAVEEAPEAPAEDLTHEGQREEPRSATGVGRARVVHGRGRGRSRGRALPGLTAKIAMTREDLEEGEIEEGEIVDEVLQPDLSSPHVPLEAHPAPEAKPETLPPPPPLRGPIPAANFSQRQPPVAATPPPQPVHFHLRRVCNTSNPVWQDAAPLHANMWMPLQSGALQVNGMQQGRSASAKLGSAAQQPSIQREQTLGKEPSNSRSHASASERASEECQRMPSPRTRDTHARSQRSVSHSRRGRSPSPPKKLSPPRKRRENLREREFREQQKDSSSSRAPRSRSSSEEAGEIMVTAPASTDAKTPELCRTPPSGQGVDRMDRSASKAASETGRSKSRDRAHRESRVEAEQETADRKRREAELIEREARERAERRKRQEDREAQKREGRHRRQREVEEQRRKDREEREKRESVREAGRLADSIKQLCQDCTTKDIMKSWDTVTRNLLAALGKLYSLHRLQKKLREAGLHQEVEFAELVAGLLEGLRHLSVFSQTGAGRSALRAHRDARELVRSTMRNRHALCTPAQQAALESIAKSSAVFTGFVNGEPLPQPPAKEKGSAAGAATEPPGLAAEPHANGTMPVGVRGAEKRLQLSAAATEQPASKRIRREAGHNLLEQLPSQHGAHQAAAAANGAAAAQTLGSPASPPTPPSEPGELEPQQESTESTGADMDVVSDLSDSQNLYAVDTGGEEVTSSAADEFIPFCPDTPPESPERAFPAPDAPDPGAAETAAAEITVPGLSPRSIHGQPAVQIGSHQAHAAGAISSTAADARLDAERQPGASSAGPRHAGGQPGVSSAGQGTAVQERRSGGASTSGRGEHSAYTQEGPVGTLLRERRLCLVLDLDHTLVNSAKFNEVEPEHLLLLEKQLQREARLPQEERRLFRLDHISMWTVLRPGLRHLLATVAPLFQLWIQTNASRAYALAVAQLLDPSGELFGQRIISKGDDGSLLTNQSKRLMQGLEECEAVCIIVDDSSDVWRHHAHNLLHVERYIYFPSSRRQLKVRRATFLEAQNDECAREGILAVTLTVLLAVHKAVFAALDDPAAGAGRDDRDWDVRHVLCSLRKQVGTLTVVHTGGPLLPGVRVLFSRVFPLDQAPESHHLWKLAETYGAVCTTELDDRVTHVVAHSRGTQKCQWALQAGKHVVSPAWLECSCTLWQRAKESAFPAPP